MNVRFNPNKIKFLLEQQGKPRPTDKELAKMLGVTESRIWFWRAKGMPLYEKIFATGIRFEVMILLSNEVICKGLGMNPTSVYHWEKSRPKAILKMEKFLNETGIKFEDIFI